MNYNLTSTQGRAKLKKTIESSKFLLYLYPHVADTCINECILLRFAPPPSLPQRTAIQVRTKSRAPSGENRIIIKLTCPSGDCCSCHLM